MEESTASVSAAYVRARLETLKAQIESVGHGATTSYWVGDTAAERQVKDDWRAGRAQWEAAWKNVTRGIKSLEDGDFDLALLSLLEAQSLAIGALGTRLRPDDTYQLAKPAKPRGRPSGKKNLTGTNN